MSIIVTNAALVHYLEHVHGLDLTPFRQEIADIVRSHKKRNGSLTHDGFRFRLRAEKGDTAVTAILPKEAGDE